MTRKSCNYSALYVTVQIAINIVLARRKLWVYKCKKSFFNAVERGFGCEL